MPARRARAGRQEADRTISAELQAKRELPLAFLAHPLERSEGNEPEFHSERSSRGGMTGLVNNYHNEYDGEKGESLRKKTAPRPEAEPICPASPPRVSSINECKSN